MKIRKSYSLTLNITDMDLAFLCVVLLHGILMFKTFYIKFGDHVIKDLFAKQEEKVMTEKIPVRIKWRLSKKARSSRFSRYIKNKKDVSFSEQIANTELTSKFMESSEGVDPNILTRSELAEVMHQQEVAYKENVKVLRELLQGNKRTFQGCYEKALLKDDLLSGVSSLQLKVNEGRLIDASSTFKGDGHKSAVGALKECLKSQSKKLNLSKIKGAHKVKFNLVFKG